MLRVANCRVEAARIGYAQACLRLDEAKAQHAQLAAQIARFETELMGSLGAQGDLAVDDWRRATAYLARQHDLLEQRRQRMVKLAEAADMARDALQGFARDQALAKKLGERAAEAAMRESARREDLAQDEQWLLLEERRS